MRSFIRWVDRFCARHPRFGIDGLMKYLIIGNAVVWLVSMMDTTGTLVGYLSLNPRMILRGQIWRLATFVLIPEQRSLLALLFLYFYYFIGTVLEREWGQAKFNLYFLSGMLFNILYAFLIFFITGRSMNVGGEFIYMSMFFSFATYYPDMQVLFLFFIPVKMKYLAIVDAAFFLYAMVTTPFPENLVPLVAVLNFLIFCGVELRAMLPRRPGKSTINFRKESARIRREQAEKRYTHKCAVCGRTDTDYPELEFRYCSRCAGYHCFCSDHINNHIHFTE